MPRSTLFKPKKKEDLLKNPLWQEIFMNEDSEDGESDGSDFEEMQVLNMYQDSMAAKGIKGGQRHTASAMAGKNSDLKLPAIDAHRGGTAKKQGSVQ